MNPVSFCLAALVAASPAPPPACQGTLSGAVHGSFECTVTLKAGEDGQALLVIEARTRLPGVPSYAPGAFEIAEPVEARTYTLDTLGQGRASVAAEGGTLYTTAKTSGQRGEVQVALTSVKKDPKVKGAYAVHGTYRARLVPAGSGKTGEVVVEVKF